MTRAEIKKLKVKVTDKMRKELEDYKSGKLPINSAPNYLLSIRECTTPDFEYGENVTNLPTVFKEMIEELERKVSELPPHVGGNYSYCPYTDYYSDYIDNNYITYNYKILKNEVHLYDVLREVDTIIAEDLRPVSAQTTRIPNVNHVDDYVTGKIEWSELVELTYPTTTITLSPSTQRTFSWR